MNDDAPDDCRSAHHGFELQSCNGLAALTHKAISCTPRKIAVHLQAPIEYSNVCPIPCPTSEGLPLRLHPHAQNDDGFDAPVPDRALH